MPYAKELSYDKEYALLNPETIGLQVNDDVVEDILTVNVDEAIVIVLFEQ